MMKTARINKLAANPAALTIEEKRQLFAAVRDLFGFECGREVFDRVVALGNPRSADDYVGNVLAMQLPCKRCANTGRFVTYVENGVPKGPGGKCFRCEGKGSQDWRDALRNFNYDAGGFAFRGVM